MTPLGVSFAKVKIDTNRATTFNCTVVGLFQGSTFFGLGIFTYSFIFLIGFIRAVDMEKELFHLVIPAYLLANIHNVNAISRSKLALHSSEYYDVRTNVDLFTYLGIHKTNSHNL